MTTAIQRAWGKIKGSVSQAENKRKNVSEVKIV